MINRDWEDATVITLSGETVNDYGEPQPGELVRHIKVYKKIYAQTNVSDPRYTEVDEIALTQDREVTTSDRLTAGGVTYAVRYVVPSPRLVTLLLRRQP